MRTLTKFTMSTTWKTRGRHRAVGVVHAALAVLLCALPVIAGAQPPVERRAGAALPDRLSAATRGAIERLADSLSREGLPSYSLRDKAAEGVLKGADDSRILLAVTSLAARLRESRALLGSAAHDEELIASSSALYAGVPGAGIAKLVSAQQRRSASTNSSLSVPLTVLAELASARVPSDVALASVDAWLARGARDADFGAFRLSVERDIRSGRTPRDAVSTSMQSTLRGIVRKE
jgi:hypothetical protein